MRPLSWNIAGVCFASLVVVGASALWQRERIGGVLQGDLANPVQGSDVHDTSTRGGEVGTLVALALVCGVVLALHAIRERREVAASTERVRTGGEPRARRADDDLAAALAAARRVAQELNLESERGARSEHSPRATSRLLDVGALETDLPFASQLRALSRVYRAVTHDLKAPLNAMVLNLDRLQVALGRSENREQGERTQRYLDVLRMELERLDRSLLALLAETTPVGDGREEFDVRSTLREIERLLQPQAHMQQVALEAMLPETAVRIAGQRDRLKQAILNVAINALESMSGGGALEMILEARPDAAELRILDTGPGIPAELQPRIFDAHFTTKSTGSGIGLYLARAIVEAHGGEIRVGNRPGRGSEFRLRLPALAQGG